MAQLYHWLKYDAITGVTDHWWGHRSLLRSHSVAVYFSSFHITGAVSTSIYYNATVTTKDGETVPLREAVQHFFNSPAWKESKETMKQIYEYYKHHGWKAIWKELVSAFDPQGEAHAYQVGVEELASVSWSVVAENNKNNKLIMVNSLIC